jgi:probable rRNA maturation factor
MLLGDIVLCAPVIRREAHEQDKELSAHYAHLLVHGVLHLLGHAHEQEAEALRMERLEASLLAQLGYANPYA